MAKKPEEETRVTSNGVKVYWHGKKLKIVGVPLIVVTLISGAVKAWMHNKEQTAENARRNVMQSAQIEKHDDRIDGNCEKIQDNKEDIKLAAQKDADIQGQLLMIREDIKANRTEQREDMAEIRRLIIESRTP